jgi:hypothetical protein
MVDMPAAAYWESAVAARLNISHYKDRYYDYNLDPARELLSACCCRRMRSFPSATLGAGRSD